MQPRPAFTRRLRSILLVGFVVAVVLVPASASASASTSGGVGIRLLDAPVDRAADPRASVYIVDHLSPGSVIERRVEVSNTTDAAVTVALSVGGAEIEDDQFRPASSGTHASRWTTVSPASVTLEPGEKAPALVRVVVPANAPDGEFYAAVWAAPPAQIAGATRVVNRVGVRMYLSVGAGREPASDFQIDAIGGEKRSDGTRLFRARVRNTGGRAIDVSGETSLANGPGGTNAGPFENARDATLLPGAIGELQFEVPSDLPDGPWDVRVVARAGSLVREAMVRLTIPSEVGTVWVEIESDGQEGRRTTTTAAGNGVGDGDGSDGLTGTGSGADEHARGADSGIPVAPAVTGTAAALIVAVSAAMVTVARRSRVPVG